MSFPVVVLPLVPAIKIILSCGFALISSLIKFLLIDKAICPGHVEPAPILNALLKIIINFPKTIRMIFTAKFYHVSTCEAKMSFV